MGPPPHLGSEIVSLQVRRLSPVRRGCFHTLMVPIPAHMAVRWRAAIMLDVQAPALLARAAAVAWTAHHGRKGSSMAYKVVATPFGGRTDTSYPLESEGLKPLGITIETADTSSDAAYLESIRDADAVIAGGKWLNGDVLNKLERCKVIANGGVGVDRIDLDAATERGIVVTNVPDVFVEEVAVHAMMLLLACAKKVVNLDKAVRENRWGEARTTCSRCHASSATPSGLIPFGNIPRLVAKKAKGFDMKIIAWDPFVSDEVFEQARRRARDRPCRDLQAQRLGLLAPAAEQGTPRAC